MILKLSFFQRLIVIELLVGEKYRKRFLKTTSKTSKTFFFPTFLFADNKSSQKQTHDNFWKWLLIKILKNSKEKAQ